MNDELDRLSAHYGWTVMERQRVEQYAKKQATMSKETFWTDELVKEYAAHLIVGKGEGITDPNKHLQAFKQSKMPKKEFEIVEFISPQGGKIRKERDDISWEQWGLKTFDGLTINAVRRLSDGEVFTVGDFVKADQDNLRKGWSDPIEKFFIIGDTMVAEFETWRHPLNDLQKMHGKKLPPQSKEQPKKERIEVMHLSKSNTSMMVYCSQEIPTGNFPQIKTALERVLNDEGEDDLDIFDKAFPKQQIEKLTEQYKSMASHLRKCIYTETQLREAELKAFNAAREALYPTAMGEKLMKYPYFENYINSKSKQ